MVIQLFANKEGALVWCAEDIIKLRHSYRILGKLIGSHSETPRQNQLMTRPLVLNAYETTLLLEKGFATLYQERDVDDAGLFERQQHYKSYHERSLSDQRKLALEQKKADIVSRSDRIVDGILKKRGDQAGSSSKEERQAILTGILKQAEGNPIQEEHMIVQQPIEHPWKQDLTEAEWKFPLTEEEMIKYITFKDLWQQEFYVSTGAKFGGDFLVYPGDPELYHAKYIAICQQSSEPLCETDMVQAARLASNVKKTALFCNVDLIKERVIYTKLDYCRR